MPADVFVSSRRTSDSRVWQLPRSSRYPLRLFLFALAYLVAYGYGALFLQTSPAPLWFPDSVLLCALLLTPLNEWWLYLVIAIPIRFIPAPHPSVPLWFVFVTSANDLIKAAFAAYLLRRLPNGSSHPSNMLQLATFLGICVFAVPILSAFAGAAARHSLGYGFWISWYQWFLGDALANVVLTPALLYWSSKRFWGLRPRVVELSLWIAGFLLSLTAALALAHSSYSPIAVCIPVPFLIWSATRFGLIGASTSLSMIALLGTARIAERSALFSMGFESKSLLFLQLFLFVVSVPVLCIATVIEEKNSIEGSLRDNERRLQLAMQAGRMFAYSWDPATDTIQRSGEAAAILGVRNDQAATGTAVSALVHHGDREKLEAALASLSPDLPWLNIAYRIRRPDGRVLWVERNSRAYFDEHDKLKRVVGMVADVTERKTVEEKLREYEKAVEGVEELIVVVDRDYRCLMANRAFLQRRRNLASEQIVGRFVHEFVVKDAYENVIKPKLDECFRGKIVRYELKYTYPEIGERDLFASYYPIEGSNGVDRAACILHDITDRKRAEQTLADMTRKLMHAQEQERARIGRELHDDINQRLAMVSVEIDQLLAKPSELEAHLLEFRKQIGEISADVQSVSHDLHPSKLEYLGAVAGMKSWCREMGERYKSEVVFSSNFAGDLPLDVGLPLFRILQEAVNNSTKHSGERRVDVELRKDSGEIHLIVRDSGKGFDVETAMHGKGLGLTSMKERVRLVNGTIAIKSRPMGGTNIHVRIPLQIQSNASPLSA